MTIKNICHFKVSNEVVFSFMGWSWFELTPVPLYGWPVIKEAHKMNSLECVPWCEWASHCRCDGDCLKWQRTTSTLTLRIFSFYRRLPPLIRIKLVLNRHVTQVVTAGRLVSRMTPLNMLVGCELKWAVDGDCWRLKNDAVRGDYWVCVSVLCVGQERRSPWSSHDSSRIFCSEGSEWVQDPPPPLTLCGGGGVRRKAGLSFMLSDLQLAEGGGLKDSRTLHVTSQQMLHAEHGDVTGRCVCAGEGLQCIATLRVVASGQRRFKLIQLTKQIFPRYRMMKRRNSW